VDSGARPADAIELSGRPDEETVPGDSRRGERHFVEAVSAEQFVFLTRLNHERLAVLAEDEDPAVVRPRRGRERAGVSREALSPVNFLSRLCVVSRQEAAIEQGIELAADDDR
jgi:hypothetical protein